MSAVERAAALRALADQLEQAAVLEQAAATAKAAYRADPSPANRAAHRTASQELNDARAAARGDLLVADATPGSVTVIPQPIATRAV